MSPAIEILEARKQAGLFSSTLNGLTSFGRAEKLRQQRGAIPPIPQAAVDAKAKSLANKTTVQTLTQRLQDPSFTPMPIQGSQEERNQIHQNTMGVLKNIEASRARPKLPLPPGPSLKSACAKHPALDVLRSRAA